MRIGLIHVSRREDTWGKYYSWEFTRRGHDVVWCAEPIGPYPEVQWRKPDCDVYVRIDDSGAYAAPWGYRPLIYLCSDTHVQDGVNRVTIVEDSDVAFIAQHSAWVDLEERFKNGGGRMKSVEWMPHAAWFFPERKAMPVEWDVCSYMVRSHEGHSIFGERTKLSHRILDELRTKGRRIQIGQGPIHHEMANDYAASRIVWHHSVGNDIAMRHFEGAACGACVVSSRIKDNGMEELFGDLIPQYDTPAECIDLIRSLLAKTGECEERGRELRKLVEACHQYRHRVDRVLGKAKGLVG